MHRRCGVLKLSVTHRTALFLSNAAEHVFKHPRGQAMLLWSIQRALHGVRLPCACLSISKDAAIVPRNAVLNNWLARHCMTPPHNSKGHVKCNANATFVRLDWALQQGKAFELTSKEQARLGTAPLVWCCQLRHNQSSSSEACGAAASQPRSYCWVLRRRFLRDPNCPAHNS